MENPSVDVHCCSCHDKWLASGESRLVSDNDTERDQLRRMLAVDILSLDTGKASGELRALAERVCTALLGGSGVPILKGLDWTKTNAQTR